MNSPTAASTASVVVRPAGSPNSHAFPGLRRARTAAPEEAAEQLVARGLHKSFRKAKDHDSRAPRGRLLGASRAVHGRGRAKWIGQEHAAARAGDARRAGPGGSAFRRSADR